MSSILLSIPYQSCKSNILLENILASFVCSDGKKRITCTTMSSFVQKTFICFFQLLKNAKALSGLQ